MTTFPQSNLALCRPFLSPNVQKTYLCLCDSKRTLAPLPLPQPSSPTSDDLDHLLANSPHLAVYIRKLDYHVSKKEFCQKEIFMVVTYVQEIGQVADAKHNLLALRRKLETWLDDITRAKTSPTSPPFSDYHQHPSVINLELSFGRFGRMCQSKKFGDSVFRVLEWCWENFGGINAHTCDAWTLGDKLG